MEKWRHIKVCRLAWFCHQAPQSLRWTLRIKPDVNKLEIVMPRGNLLDFKLTGGAWVRPQEKKQT
jgi:hypothetical protein